ncbi:hypothetical protein [Modestobacter versicolor]|uniref:Lysylphosphatidylglycerol synthetase-like protein (DUF2156 family) n=1 Tax=Modestobacter versicolor TaxID=429133 RepID=A0A323VJU6_9ACTN|nr:hypothetical protein [Modestobacter versicolor]MBB3675568.1 lysylphosphatidylglycerol synthetase-like protein (DUF2156 family) [Modestobacter versicolor]PZA20238.1 hypothetical protein DMO24_16515 [Modestobacter versicolor]
MPTPPTRRSPRRAAPAAPATSATTRSRTLGRGFTAAPTAPVRPLAAPFAAAFGVLVAAEDAYLGWLLWDADPGWGWYLLLPALPAVAALAGALLVLRGRSLSRRVSGSAVLALACLVPLLGLLGLAVFFALLGGGQAVWWALLLLVGPIGGLALALQRPVRRWTRGSRVASPGRPGRGSR